MFRVILLRILFLVCLYTVLFAYLAKADFLELQEVSIDYKNFRMINPGGRNPLTYPEAPKEGLDFKVNTNLFWGWAFVEATVESLTTVEQFREVGLSRRLGVHLGKYADLSLYHLSEHALDRGFQIPGGFPEEDAVELKVWIYRR